VSKEARNHTPEAQVRTETFTLLAICEWFNVLNCRSELKSALHLGVLRNLCNWVATGRTGLYQRPFVPQCRIRVN
jgi:hypothetical protein